MAEDSKVCEWLKAAIQMNRATASHVGCNTLPPTEIDVDGENPLALFKQLEAEWDTVDEFLFEIEKKRAQDASER